MKNRHLIHLVWLCIFDAGFNSFGQTWLQKGTSIYGQAATDYFGQSVAMSGDGSTIAAGAVGNDQAGSNSGNTRILSWNGNAWIQKGIDLTGDAADDAAGSAVSLNYDGTVLAIGVPGSNKVKFYQWNGISWVLKGARISGETFHL